MSEKTKKAEIAEMRERHAEVAKMIREKIAESLKGASPEELSKIPVKTRVKIFEQMEEIKKRES